MTTSFHHTTTPSLHHSSTPFAWHGWQLNLPSRWNPVKIEGDYTKGHVLFADLRRARLGLRWQTVGKKFDADAWKKRAMRDEVGQLAANMAAPAAGGLLFVEPEPPGRDVWVAHSAVSNRVIELVYHIHRRERILEEAILTTLVDLPVDGKMPWSIFDLSCRVDARMKLVEHQLNAGDLTLAFAARGEKLILRQIALAEMALRRMPIEKWLAQVQLKHYEFDGEPESIAIHRLGGIICKMRRKMRFSWMRWIKPKMFACALHDAANDRLFLCCGNDRAHIEVVASTLGSGGD